MIKLLGILLLVSCSKPSSIVGPSLPAASYSETYSPVRDDFGYDPQHAIDLYDLPEDFKFYNLDPNKFNGKALDMLGNFSVMTTLEAKLPASLYILLQDINGGYNSYYDNGGNPSPYNYHNDLKVKVGDKTLSGTVPLGVSIGKASSNGNDYISITCLTCHASVVGNSLVAGTYNVHRAPDLIHDYIKQSEIPNKAILTVGLTLHETFNGNPTLLTPSFDTEDDKVINNVIINKELIFDYIYPDMTGLTNVAHNDAAASGLFPTLMDGDVDTWNPNLVAFDTYKYRIQQVVQVPVFVPSAWWLSRYRGIRESRRMHSPHDRESFVSSWTAFFSWPNFSGAQQMPWEERREKMSALASYMDAIQSPQYPKYVDNDLAKIGHKVYESSCSKCHGSFEKQGEQYRLYYDIRNSWFQTKDIKVSSDATTISANYVMSTGLEHMETLLQFTRDNIKYNLPRYGVEAPPLVGIWATAPYMHNHSVPTIYQMLNSKARSTVWEQSSDRYAYDYIDVGIVAKPVLDNYKPSRYIYDTRAKYLGMSNSGHYFGDKLSDFERYAVIEFLKTVSTENVIPNPK